MAARRLFVSKLSVMLDSIYDDFMNDTKTLEQAYIVYPPTSSWAYTVHRSGEQAYIMYKSERYEISDFDLFDPDTYESKRFELYDLEEFNPDTNEIEMDLEVSKNGRQLICNFLFNRNVCYSWEGLQWTIEIDPLKVDYEELGKLKDWFWEDWYADRSTYSTRHDWQYFCERLLVACVEFDAGKYGYLSLAQCEQEVQLRFDKLCASSLVARHAHTEVMHPLFGPNMAQFL